MKKRGLAVLLLAVALTIGTAMTSYADGWAQENNSWVYLDSNGSKITQAWRRDADNLWRYLDANGRMAVSTWVEDVYFVDSNGIMVTDKWLKLTPVNSSEAQYWYYFGDSGKMITNAWKKIDNKMYYFDDAGMLQTGWIDDTYYCADDGVMRTGWHLIPPPDNGEDDDYYDPDFDSNDGKYWFHFSTTGKVTRSDKEYTEKKIDDKYYCFRSDGAMQTGWRLVGEGSDIDSYKFYGSDGARKNGWIQLESPSDLPSDTAGDELWFYLDKNGVPKKGNKNGELSTQDIGTISGSPYLFNEYGNPLTGLYKIRIGNTDQYTTVYGDPSKYTLATGTRTIEESDGTKTSFFFSESGSTKGHGFSGVKNNYLYYMGKRQKADTGMRYSLISIPKSNDSGYTTYVVNTSGTIQKSKTVKDSDGTKFKTNGSGVLTHINDEASDGGYNPPQEPNYEN